MLGRRDHQRQSFAVGSATSVTTTGGDPGTTRTRYLPRAIPRSRASPVVVSGGGWHAEPTCVARMKRLRNKKTNGASRMDLSKRKPADYMEVAYREAISKLKYLLAESYAPTGMSGTKPHSIRGLYKGSNPRISESGDDTDDQSAISNSFRRRDNLAGNNAASNILPSLSRTNQLSKTYSNVALSRADLQSVPPELTSFIERQEDYIEQLERESQYCRDELINLLSKVREVVAENEALHNRNQIAVSKCASQHDHHRDHCVAVADHECRGTRNTRDVDDDASQIKQETLPAVGPSIIFESRISELEAQLTQARLELRKTREENQACLKRLSESDTSEAGGGGGLKAELDKAMCAKYEAEMKSEKLQRLLSAARDKETEAIERAKRSVDDRQQYEYERGQSQMEIRRLKDELERQHEKLREAAQEANRRVTEERQQLERRYSQEIEQLTADIASHWEVANKAQLESEKQRREINELRRELSQKQTAVDNLKKELQNKISTVQSDLNQALSEKDAAEQEVLTGKLTAERNERQARQEQSRLQAEINSYKQRLERGDADLVHCRRENLRLLEQIASLEKEISMSKIVRGQENRPEEITPRTENEKELTSMIMDMETKHERVVEKDATTVGQTASPSSKKRTVKVDLKVKVIPKRKSDTSKASLSAQEEMADLQSNIEHLSNKIQGSFVSHEGGTSMEINNDIGAFRYGTAMDSVDPPRTNGLQQIGRDGLQTSRMIDQSYDIASGEQQMADEGAYSKGNDQFQDNLYDLPSDRQNSVGTRSAENNFVPSAMESAEMYQQQRDDRDNNGEYIADDTNVDAYVAEGEHDRYSGYDSSQYQEGQYANGEQFDAIAEQTEDNQNVTDPTVQSADETLH